MMQFSFKILFLTVYIFFAYNTWSSGPDDSDCDSSSSHMSLPHTLGSSVSHHSGEEHTTDSSTASPHTLSLQEEEPYQDPLYGRNAPLAEAGGGAEDSGDVEALLAQSEGERLEDILEGLEVKREELEAQDVPYESLAKIWDVERRALTSSLRWASVDGLVKKGLIWGVVRKRDILAHETEHPFLSYGLGIRHHTGRAIYMDTGEAVGVVNEESRLLSPAEEKTKKKRCCDAVWMYGGSVPLTGEKPYRKMTAWDEAREGVGFVVFRGLHLGIYAFLGYDLATAIQEGGVNFSILTNLFRGQDEAAINHILSVLQNPAGPYLASTAVALPFLWGGAKGIWASYQRATLSIAEQEHILHYFKDAPQGKWRDVFRWILPFHPIDKCVNSLLRHARWDGTLNTQDLSRIQGVFEELALKRYGYTQIVAMHALAKMVYANHLKDYKRLKGEGVSSERFKARVLGELLMKAKGLEILETLAQTRERWRNREGFWDGTDRVWKSVYANYLLWTLGQNRSWVFGTTMLGWKTVKAVTLSLLFKTFIQALIEYTRCPHVFQNLHHGELGPVNDRIQCFESYLKAFNTIPGQPISSLTQLVPHVLFPNPYDLSLANKGIRGYQVADLLTAIHSYHPDLYLRTLNLTGNILDQPQDFDTLMPAIGAFHSLEALDLSNSNMGSQGVNATLAFAHGMPHLSTLQILDLTVNRLGYTGTAGVEAIGEGLQYLPNLRVLVLEGNEFGASDSALKAIGDGFQYLSHMTLLNLRAIAMSNAPNGIKFIGEGFQHLPNLTSLNLRDNSIGSINVNGTKAIGKGLQYLRNLNYLGLGNNVLGGLDINGAENIARGIKHLFQLTTLDLGGNLMETYGHVVTENIAKSLQYLPNLTSLDLGTNMIGYGGISGTEAIGESLKYLPNLTSLNLAYNWIEYTKETAGTEAIGEGLKHLPNLTSLILGGNSIGYGGISGTEAIGESLKYLPNLTSLNLGGNAIGSKGTNGFEAIAKGLQPLSHLTSLDLSGNDMALHPNATQALVNQIIYMPALKALHLQQKKPLPISQMKQLRKFWQHRGSTDIYILRTIEDIKNYLEVLPSNTTNINLGGLLVNPSGELMTKLMQQLGRFPNLTALDLSEDRLDQNSTEILGNNLKYFPCLTSLDLSSSNGTPTEVSSSIASEFKFVPHLASLNLSGISIYPLYQGVEIFIKGLKYLPNLTSLDLSENSLGQTKTSGTEALGKSLHHLPQLTSLNLNNNKIGSHGTKGTEAIGEGVKYLTHLKELRIANNELGSQGSQGVKKIGESIGALSHLQYLDLSDNPIGTHGSEGVKALFENISFGQLCEFNIIGAQNIPWTEGQRAVYELNRKPIQESCYAQRCFGKTVAPVIPSPCGNGTETAASATSPTSSPVSGRTLLQYDNLDPLPEEAEAAPQELLEVQEDYGKGDSWTQRIQHKMHGVWQGTKNRVNGMTDWVLERVIRYVDQVTHENESYFPNIDDPTQRYWGETSVVNATSSWTNSTVSVAAAPTGALPAN